MLAVVGVLVQELYQWNDAFPSKNFIEALKTAPVLGLVQLFFFVGAYDVTTSKYEGRVPGGAYIHESQIDSPAQPMGMKASASHTSSSSLAQLPPTLHVSQRPTPTNPRHRLRPPPPLRRRHPRELGAIGAQARPPGHDRLPRLPRPGAFQFTFTSPKLSLPGS